MNVMGTKGTEASVLGHLQNTHKYRWRWVINVLAPSLE